MYLEFVVSETGMSGNNAPMVLCFTYLLCDETESDSQLQYLVDFFAKNLQLNLGCDAISLTIWGNSNLNKRVEGILI